jgi:hypothetical protein
MEFILNRDKVLSSIKGHTIEFKKGEPTYVPVDMHSEAMAIGAMPTGDLPDEPEIEGGAPTDPAERERVIMEAMEQLVLRNQRGDFIASGLPNVAALKDLMGFSIHHKERDTVWTKVQAKQRGEA